MYRFDIIIEVVDAVLLVHISVRIFPKLFGLLSKESRAVESFCRWDQNAFVFSDLIQRQASLLPFAKGAGECPFHEKL